MESPEEQTNRIALWPGRNREDGDKPYLTGTVNIDGKKYFVSLWKRERKTRQQPLLSGNVELANDQLDI